MIGLGLIAAAFYLAFVLYLGWDGGRVGGWLADGLENAFGQVSYVVPLALRRLGRLADRAAPHRDALGAQRGRDPGARGAAARPTPPRLPASGPSSPVRHDYFEQKFMVAHGGAVGEGLYWAATTLFQRLGAHILVVLLMLSGVLLLTGTTLVSALGSTGRALRKAGTGTRDVARTVRAQRATPPDPWEAAPDAAITISRERETDTFETGRLAAELEDEDETIAVREGDDPDWGPADDDPSRSPPSRRPRPPSRRWKWRPRRWGAAVRETGSPSPRRSPTGCRP